MAVARQCSCSLGTHSSTTAFSVCGFMPGRTTVMVSVSPICTRPLTSG